MKRSNRYRLSPALPLITAALFTGIILVGCGKPQSKGGPPGGAVNAVVAPVEVAPLADVIEVVGTFQAQEITELAAEQNGTIEEILFEEGSVVQKGALLFRLDDSTARAALKVARAELKYARAEFERARKLLKNDTISQEVYDEAERNLARAEGELALAKENLENTQVIAPYPGQVSERTLSLGQYVHSGDVLTTLVQNNPLEVALDVPERFVPRVQKGQEITITTTAYPDTPFTGTVIYVAPLLDEKNRTLRVKARVENPKGRLSPGMFGIVSLTTSIEENARFIPEAAVFYSQNQAQVYVLDDEDKTKLASIKTGKRQTGKVQILEGLERGDRVVVEGHQKMGPGTPVKLAPESTRYGLEPTVGKASENGGKADKEATQTNESGNE